MTATNKRIGLQGVAKLFGVSLYYMNIAKPYLDGFPAEQRVGPKKLYWLSEVKDWAADKDVKALILESVRKYRHGDVEARAELTEILNLSRRLHAGEFDTADQRYFHAIKRWTARDRHTQTTRVSIRPDWALEQETSC